FHTDGDLPAARDARDVARLLDRARRCPELAELLAATTFPAAPTSGFVPAHGAVLAPLAGPGWAAVGDAALGFDPLSSQGLFNALYTGLVAAEAVDRHLDGDARALEGYADLLARVRAAYVGHRARTYGAERRGATRPVWRRRHVPEDTSTGAPPPR